MGVLRHHACALSYMSALAWSTHRTLAGRSWIAVGTVQRFHATVLPHELD
jgi:hypothetical protein